MKLRKQLKKIDNYFVSSRASIRQAVKKMDSGGMGFVCVVDSSRKMKGIITDGDFRRAICSGVALENNVMNIMTQDFVSVDANYASHEVKKIFNRGPIDVLPVLQNGEIQTFLFPGDFLTSNPKLSFQKKNTVDLPVVIMAGGKGTRLDPLTRILPKPLIPLGDKTVIELIMDRFGEFGICDFYVSLHHKSKMIRAFFEELGGPYRIKYLEEKSPLGTAGSLGLLKNKIKKAFFVTNCDVLIRCHYDQVYRLHKQNQHDLTIVTAMRHYKVPYGICHIDKKGQLKSIEEKPQYDFLISTGMYLLNPDVIPEPQEKPFNMTDLIRRLIRQGKKVGVFPVSEKSWIDVGQMEEYKKNLELLNTVTREK